MSKALEEYFSALERLKSNCPINVPKGTKIHKDSVALEAGRGKGSIKKSRPVFVELIQAIESATNLEKLPTEKLEQFKLKAEKFRVLYEASLAREISLLRQVHELKQEIHKFRSSSLTSIDKIK